MIKCFGCQNEIKLEHKSLRYQSKWYHQKCIEILKKESFETKNTIPRKIKKKIDSIQFILAGSIIVFLVAAVFFLLGPISMFTMAIGGGLTCYHMIEAAGKLFSKNHQ